MAHPRRFSSETERQMASAYESGESTTSLALRYNATSARIGKILNRRGVIMRKQHQKRFTKAQREEIAIRYRSGESTTQIASSLGVKHPSIANALRYEGVQLRGRAELAKSRVGKAHPNFGKKMSPGSIAKMKLNIPDRQGEQSPSWKGGRYRANGYIYVYAPNHPHATKMGYVREHRLEMEKHLNRRLKRSEVVHHVNGARDDNRIENLMLFENQKAHMEHHATLSTKDTEGACNEA